MKRFTVNVNGANYAKTVDGKIISGDLIDTLAAYEDTGLEPEEVNEYCKAKEDGRLKELKE